MSKLQRRLNIVKFINERGYVPFSELKERFSDASEMTLRTDLKELDKEEKIIRVRGGARTVKETAKADDSYFLRYSRNVEQRKQIAMKAAEYLKEQLSMRPSVTIFLDCGVTITEITNYFPDEWCTVVTNSISCAYSLASLKRPEVTLLGGMLNRYNCCCDSSQHYDELERMNFDIMFLSVAAYCPDVGFTCGKEVVEGPRWAVKKKATKVIVPLTSSKIGPVFPITHATLEDVDMIICDNDMPQEIKQHFLDNGIEVL